MRLNKILHRYIYVTMGLFLLLSSSCSSTKHVPAGQYLVDDVKIEINDNKNIKSKELVNYLRQTPNHKVFGAFKMQLALYNISGKDSTNWFNKWIRRVGNPPVIYDQNLTDASANQLQKALENKGYLGAKVTYNLEKRDAKKKIRVKYNITTGTPHYISSISYNIPNDTLCNIIMADSASFILKQNDLFDRKNLDLQRQQITERLRNKGYYAFNKDYITFTVDTAANSKEVNVTLNTRSPYANDKMPYYKRHQPFYVRNVTFITNYDPLTMHENQQYSAEDSIQFKNFKILYGKDKYIRPSVLEESCFIEPGNAYSSTNTDKTYQALGRLGILKFININFRPVGEIDGKIYLDAYILLTKGKSQTMSLSLEGTNSEGDLGFGVGASYQHRNIGKGSEILNTKFRASYESLSGDVTNLINNKYTEYTADIGITFPKFKFPFLKKNFKQKILATTELATSFSYQERPEYTRIIAGAAWKYHWTEKKNTTRHTFDLIDVNYVYLPKSKLHFLDSITNPLLRYSYENHFIMRAGYVFYNTNKLSATPFKQRFQTNIYTFRAGIEIAGNFFYAMSNLFGQERDNGTYKIFGISYSQYVKGEADYTLTHKFNERHMLAFHAGAGIGVPYGNSTILPFEKRFYAGGANGVRGWAVRTLGPGTFNGNNSVNNFINQCGDIRLNLSLEYRTKLFWVVEMGIFVDAGNIWTIRDYENQPGGKFKFNSFYKEIAAAYGLGIRLDFTYFLLRFDLGMKAHNPAKGQEAWPIFSPNWRRDATFHFSVGYPF
ncbi:MAG: BamA/TamA family outer membrane protein [Muribaculaceae bacterium]